MTITWGSGAKPANIFFIGNFPTAFEKRTLRLFEGKKYLVFNRLMRMFNWNKRNAYFTHIIKCKTPKNRVPTTIEVDKCNPYLTQEIQETTPKIIVLVGEAVMQRFYGDLSLRIYNEHGVIRKIGRTYIIATLSPMHTTHTDAKLLAVLDDYTKVFNLYQQLFPLHRKLPI